MTTRMAASNMELHALSTGREPRVATVTRVLRQTLFRCGGGAERSLGRGRCGMSGAEEVAPGGGGAARSRDTGRGQPEELGQGRSAVRQSLRVTGRGGARAREECCGEWGLGPCARESPRPLRAKVPGPRRCFAGRGRRRRDGTAALQRASPWLLQPAAFHGPG